MLGRFQNFRFRFGPWEMIRFRFWKISKINNEFPIIISWKVTIDSPNYNTIFLEGLPLPYFEYMYIKDYKSSPLSVKKFSSSNLYYLISQFLGKQTFLQTTLNQLCCYLINVPTLIYIVSLFFHQTPYIQGNLLE